MGVGAVEGGFFERGDGIAFGVGVDAEDGALWGTLDGGGGARDQRSVQQPTICAGIIAFTTRDQKRALGVQELSCGKSFGWKVRKEGDQRTAGGLGVGEQTHAVFAQDHAVADLSKRKMITVVQDARTKAQRRSIARDDLDRFVALAEVLEKKAFVLKEQAGQFADLKAAREGVVREFKSTSCLGVLERVAWGGEELWAAFESECTGRCSPSDWGLERKPDLLSAGKQQPLGLSIFEPLKARSEGEFVALVRHEPALERVALVVCGEARLLVQDAQRGAVLVEKKGREAAFGEGVDIFELKGLKEKRRATAILSLSFECAEGIARPRQEQSVAIADLAAVDVRGRGESGGAAQRDTAIRRSIDDLRPPAAFCATSFEDQVFDRGFAVVEDDIIALTIAPDGDEKTLRGLFSPRGFIADKRDLWGFRKAAKADPYAPKQDG